MTTIVMPTMNDDDNIPVLVLPYWKHCSSRLCTTVTENSLQYINDDYNDNNGDADGNPQFDEDDDGNAAVLYVLYFQLVSQNTLLSLISVFLHTIDGNDSVYAVNNNADNGRLTIQLSFFVTDLPTALTNNNKMNINDDDTTKLVYPLFLPVERQLKVCLIIMILSVPRNENPLL